MIIEWGETYTPEKMLFREEHERKICNEISIFRKNGKCSCLRLQGYTGTGKTSMMNFVINKMGLKFQEEYLFASGSSNHTCHQFLSTLFDLNLKTVGALIESGKRKLMVKPRIIILDEINRIQDKREIVELFNALDAINRETGCPIFIMTNLFNLKKIISPDAWSNLSLELIEFPPYTYSELFAIFSERAKITREKSSIDIRDDFIKKVCIKSMQDGEGSARQVRIIIDRCIMKQDFSDKHVDYILEGISEENIMQRLKNMTLKEKEFTLVLEKIFSHKKEKGILPLHISYNEIRKYTNYSFSQISYYVEKLEMEYGLIKTIRQNKGRRGGNSTLVKFDSDYFTEVQSWITENSLNSSTIKTPQQILP